MLTQKQILKHFDLDENDAENLDPYVDWEALGKSIEGPTRVAVCNILDKKGEIVMSGGKEAKVIMDVPVSNVKEELKKKSLRFVEWY